MNTEQSRQEIMAEVYASGKIPWDAELPPPEVIALADALPIGRVLDIGCGYGRASIYLARRGWSVDGIDFIPAAIEVARERAAHAGQEAINFAVGSITDLSRYEDGRFDLVIDVGCAHGLGADEWDLHAAELSRLIKPGGRYLLFARLLGKKVETGKPGLDEARVSGLLQAEFELERVERGRTEMPDEAWESAWYWYRRQPKSSRISDE